MLTEESHELTASVYLDFLTRLEPQLRATQRVEDQLNRQLAHRFNVFDYLGTLELGLSRFIADLLDPHAKHGQGSLFLELFLRSIRPDFESLFPSLSDARVTVEKLIENQRRIDIYVQIPTHRGEYCLAFENKPYAVDQENQITDYLAHLKKTFEGNFDLIYLSPNGERPSEWSVGRRDLEDIEGTFAVMAYVSQSAHPKGVSSEDQTEDARDLLLSQSLVDWLFKCRTQCDVERLRWFLKDAAIFCQSKFGDYEMNSDSAESALREVLDLNPEHLVTAQSVYKSWMSIRNSICEEFLTQIFDQIQRKVREKWSEQEDIVLGQKYNPKWGKTSRIWLYKDSWEKFKDSSSDSEGRMSIRLSSYANEPTGWFVGVSSPKAFRQMEDDDKRYWKIIEEKIRVKIAGSDTRHFEWWPAHRLLEESRGVWADWNAILPSLRKECKARSGEITEYYVNQFMDVAEIAIPIIDDNQAIVQG